MDNRQNTPPFRSLKGYAFDLSLSLQLDTVDVNELIYKIEWESFCDDEEPGPKYPSGEYIEIIDFDPSSEVFYPPVNLDDPYLLATQGLEPSVSSPQFHQQMVYAVIMTTIKNFEKALGRKILWADRISSDKGSIDSSFVGKLRVYPHGLTQANACYNPHKKALLFGYFSAKAANAGLRIPGGTVFTCLSHDIIAHETTHAILDGLHRRYIEPTNVDTRAFHEAFADIVALFQHFTFPEVLKHQISQTRGNLSSQNLLGQLALEFGRAIGKYGSLRDSIGHTDDVTKQWHPHVPSPAEYQEKTEFHERGSILVSAIFEAFLTIYKRRIQSLLRIATGGTGVLPDGELHPDLVNNLASIAAKTASTVLNMCVRALDFCPPVDITFGDYLRAIVTADEQMVKDDEGNFRVAFIEAFQKRGIFPRNLKSMSVEVLCYPKFPSLEAPEMELIFGDFLRDFQQAISYETDREKIHRITKEFIAGRSVAKQGLHDRLYSKFIREQAGRDVFSDLTGLLFPQDEKQCKEYGVDSNGDIAKYEVSNLWLANRVSPSEKIVNDVIITLSQRRGVVAQIDQDNIFSVSGYFVPDGKPRVNGFVFRGGCTLIFDLASRKLKFAIKKSISDEIRMELQFRYIRRLEADGSSYFTDKSLSALAGPFAFMHAFDNHVNP